MVPFSIMFHCGFSDPRGSGALRAMFFSCEMIFSVYYCGSFITNVISSFDGVILPRVRVGLSNGAFLRSSLSVETWLSGCGSPRVGCWFFTLSSGSEFCSMSHIAVGVITGCFSSLRSEAFFFIFVYDSFCFFGFGTMFESAVFGFLPKCASKGVIFSLSLGSVLCFVLC